MRVTTLGVIRDGDSILLGMKKRGFGVGKWNGFGGKVGDFVTGESIKSALCREFTEEININVNEDDLVNMSLIHFHFAGNTEWDNDMHVFFVDRWSGDIKESEEMIPQWFSVENIPYDKMWQDDKVWLPIVLNGVSLEGDVYFDDDNKLIDWSLKHKNFYNA
jgi:8-oxo-dGTP diphosphatase